MYFLWIISDRVGVQPALGNSEYVNRYRDLVHCCSHILLFYITKLSLAWKLDNEREGAANSTVDPAVARVESSGIRSAAPVG